MQVAEPLIGSWKAFLSLDFAFRENRSVLERKEHDGPLVVQKPLYPEGPEVCHAIVVHPPGGIAGGDELILQARIREKASALLTTPGAAKWYRSAGPLARQRLRFEVRGTLEWLPQEAIVFDGALAEMQCDVELAAGARFLGWDIVCLGRGGSGERFARGALRFATRVRCEGRPLWIERGRIEGGAGLMTSAAGLAGKSVFGTLFACAPDLSGEAVSEARKIEPEAGDGAVTRLPGILLARYLGDSSEAARRYFSGLWRILRPALAGREANEPRIWRT
ncbi:MAG: urease accessory protein UreD [Pseudomonadota bacterium]